MKITPTVEWIGGFLLSTVFAILSPFASQLLLKFFRQLGIVWEPPRNPYNLRYMIIEIITILFVSICLPLIIRHKLRNRLPSLSSGLLLGMVVIGIPGAFLITGTILFIGR